MSLLLRLASAPMNLHLMDQTATCSTAGRHVPFHLPPALFSQFLTVDGVSLQMAQANSLVRSVQVDLHGLHVDEALKVLETHLNSLGGLGHPGGVLLQVSARIETLCHVFIAQSRKKPTSSFISSHGAQQFVCR